MNQELRQIIWKESYLVKRLVAVLVALGFVGIVGIALESDPSHRFFYLLRFVNMLTIVVAFAIGATMFAGETEYDTDRLLQRFGISPGSIWQGKILVGICGLLALWLSLTVFSGLIDFFLRISMRQSLSSGSSEFKSHEFWGSIGLAFEALLCGILCSCWFKRVLTALISAVVLFFVSIFLIKFGIDGFRFQETRNDSVATILTHGTLIFLLLIANWYSIFRWFAGDRRGFLISISISLPKFRSRITSRYHECSPQKRFVTRIIWYELRQHALIWLAVALFTIISSSAFSNSFPFMLCYVTPLLMGLVSCYSEQNRDRARFWYQRGASSAVYWWSKNAVWLSVIGCLFFVQSFWTHLPSMMKEFARLGSKYYDPNYPDFWRGLSVASAPQLTDFPSNLWFYVLLLYFIGQWAIVRVPHAILAAICAMVLSLAGIAMMNLCQVAYVPLWVVLTPAIVALAVSSYWGCNNMLRDLPDPGNRHRWRMALLPCALIICCIFFLGYRTRGVTTMLSSSPHFPYEEWYEPERILTFCDEAYSDKYFELVQSFPSIRDINRRAKEIVEKKIKEGRVQNAGIGELQQIEINKIYKAKIKKQEKTLLELANLLDSQYKSNQPMRIDLLKEWRSKPDFHSSEYYYSLSIPDYKFYAMLGNGFSQEEWLLPLTNKEMIRLLWNLGEAHAHLGDNRHGAIAMPAAFNGYLARIYSEKNLQRLYDQEDAASLRELIEESIQRESRITSMKQIVTLWFAYAAFQLDHDNQYVWEYLCGIPWNSADKAEQEHEQYLIEKLFYPPRWTILPTEKFRAKTLLYSANGFYWRQAHFYDDLLNRQIAVNTVSDRIGNRREEWLRSGDTKRFFESTLAVYDFARDWQMMRNFDQYVSIHEKHRKHTILFALLAFAKENNCYPDKLEELVPDYLKELPVDPWTGKPFGYIGPNFAGKIDLPYRGNDEKEVTYPFLWSSGWQEAELVETDRKSQPQHYIFASRKEYRNRVLASGSSIVGTFEENASMFEVHSHSFGLLELPKLSGDDKP